MSPSTLLALPDELIRQIIEYAPFTALRQTCRRLRTFSKDHWHAVVLRHPALPPFKSTTALLLAAVGQPAKSSLDLQLRLVDRVLVAQTPTTRLPLTLRYVLADLAIKFHNRNYCQAALANPAGLYDAVVRLLRLHFGNVWPDLFTRWNEVFSQELTTYRWLFQGERAQGPVAPEIWSIALEHHLTTTVEINRDIVVDILNNATHAEHQLMFRRLLAPDDEWLIAVRQPLAEFDVFKAYYAIPTGTFAFSDWYGGDLRLDLYLNMLVTVSTLLQYEACDVDIANGYRFTFGMFTTVRDQAGGSFFYSILPQCMMFWQGTYQEYIAVARWYYDYITYETALTARWWDVAAYYTQRRYPDNSPTHPSRRHQELAVFYDLADIRAEADEADLVRASLKLLATINALPVALTEFNTVPVATDTQ